MGRPCGDGRITLGRHSVNLPAAVTRFDLDKCVAETQNQLLTPICSEPISCPLRKNIHYTYFFVSENLS